MSLPEQSRLRRDLARRGIRDPRVLEAFESVPREEFVPPEYRSQAYDDCALPLSQGQTISQPYIVALMTEALALDGDECVLEIGTGSGYQAAILSRLCRRVVTVERLPELSAAARRVLEALGCDNVECLVGDGTLGVPEDAPYEGIIVTAAAPRIPPPLYEQLAEGGRLAIPTGDESIQELIVVTKTATGPRSEVVCGCRFVKLIGEEGWK
jgi:protein-L-isoaspartate(D-aspartate) O-methyltransferase